jgi:hypothetical protein
VLAKQATVVRRKPQVLKDKGQTGQKPRDYLILSAFELVQRE